MRKTRVAGVAGDDGALVPGMPVLPETTVREPRMLVKPETTVREDVRWCCERVECPDQKT